MQHGALVKQPDVSHAHVAAGQPNCAVFHSFFHAQSCKTLKPYCFLAISAPSRRGVSKYKGLDGKHAKCAVFAAR